MSKRPTTTKSYTPFLGAVLLGITLSWLGMTGCEQGTAPLDEESAASNVDLSPTEGGQQGSGLGSALVVTGQVVSANGEPVSGATIWLDDDGKTIHWEKDGASGLAAMDCPSDEATCTITLSEAK